MSSFSTNVVHRAACPLAWIIWCSSVNCQNSIQLWRQNLWVISSLTHAILYLPYLCISWVPSPLPLFSYSSQFYLPLCVPGGAGLTQCVPSIHSPPQPSICTFSKVLLSILCPATTPRGCYITSYPTACTKCPKSVQFWSFAPWGCTLWEGDPGHWRDSTHVSCLGSYKYWGFKIIFILRRTYDGEHSWAFATIKSWRGLRIKNYF